MNDDHTGHGGPQPRQLGFGNSGGYRIYELTGLATGEPIAKIYATDKNYAFAAGKPQWEYWEMKNVSQADLASGFKLQFSKEHKNTELPTSISGGVGDKGFVAKSKLISVKTSPPTSRPNGTGVWGNSDSTSNAVALELFMAGDPVKTTTKLDRVRFYFKDLKSPAILADATVADSYKFKVNLSQTSAAATEGSTPIDDCYYYEEQARA